jgi:hypothetical protein
MYGAWSKMQAVFADAAAGGSRRTSVAATSRASASSRMLVAPTFMSSACTAVPALLPAPPSNTSSVTTFDPFLELAAGEAAARSIASTRSMVGIACSNVRAIGGDDNSEGNVLPAANTAADLDLSVAAAVTPADLAAVLDMLFALRAEVSRIALLTGHANASPLAPVQIHVPCAPATSDIELSVTLGAPDAPCPLPAEERSGQPAAVTDAGCAERSMASMDAPGVLHAPLSLVLTMQAEMRALRESQAQLDGTMRALRAQRTGASTDTTGMGDVHSGTHARDTQHEQMRQQQQEHLQLQSELRGQTVQLADLEARVSSLMASAATVRSPPPGSGFGEVVAGLSNLKTCLDDHAARLADLAERVSSAETGLANLADLAERIGSAETGLANLAEAEDQRRATAAMLAPGHAKRGGTDNSAPGDESVVRPAAETADAVAPAADTIALDRLLRDVNQLRSAVAALQMQQDATLAVALPLAGEPETGQRGGTGDNVMPPQRSLGRRVSRTCSLVKGDSMLISAPTAGEAPSVLPSPRPASARRRSPGVWQRGSGVPGNGTDEMSLPESVEEGLHHLACRLSRLETLHTDHAAAIEGLRGDVGAAAAAAAASLSSATATGGARLSSTVAADTDMDLCCMPAGNEVHTAASAHDVCVLTEELGQLRRDLDHMTRHLAAAAPQAAEAGAVAASAATEQLAKRVAQLEHCVLPAAREDDGDITATTAVTLRALSFRHLAAVHSSPGGACDTGSATCIGAQAHQIEEPLTREFPATVAAVTGVQDGGAADLTAASTCEWAETAFASSITPSLQQAGPSALGNSEDVDDSCSVSSANMALPSTAALDAQLHALAPAQRRAFLTRLADLVTAHADRLLLTYGDDSTTSAAIEGVKSRLCALLGSSGCGGPHGPMLARNGSTSRQAALSSQLYSGVATGEVLLGVLEQVAALRAIGSATTPAVRDTLQRHETQLAALSAAVRAGARLDVPCSGPQPALELDLLKPEQPGCRGVPYVTHSTSMTMNEASCDQQHTNKSEDLDSNSSSSLATFEARLSATVRTLAAVRDRVGRLTEVGDTNQAMLREAQVGHGLLLGRVAALEALAAYGGHGSDATRQGTQQGGALVQGGALARLQVRTV